MAASGRDPQRPVSSSLPGGFGSSLTGTRLKLLLSEKERQSWPVPTGQKSKGIRKASSYLLHQLIHGYQEPDTCCTHHYEYVLGEDEYLKENEAESEESSKTEMLNLKADFDGILREEVVAKALHQLGRSGSGTEQVYLNLTLPGCDLTDVSILSGYVHLQKLDLSVNKIEDLSCVGCMPYLLELNASHNKLTTFFNFKPPKNLKKVDFSCNQISEMCDLSAYQALTKLILDNNEIEEISGLEQCCSLAHLSLAQNRIKTISGLQMLPIKILCLSNNQIEKITGLEELKGLQLVDLSYNQISSLQGLENHEFLEIINLEHNKIAELNEIEHIEHLPLLRVLSLLGNPIQEKSDYWFFVIFMLLRLTELDQKKIKVEEKVAAINKYDPPPEVVAVRDHLTHVVNSVLQPQKIFDSTLPSLDAPYPMLILAGPQACGKRELAHRLCRQFNTYFRYGACHTTRPPYFGEGDRVDYHFISQEVFDEMLNMGKFILTYNYGNHSYGLNRDTVDGIARDGLASCIHMEIEGVRSLKYSYFEPRYIMVVPMNKKKYEGYLRRKGLFSRAEIEFAVSRVDLYIKINQKFPGYFDAVINADDLDVAYQNLSQLVREYLGLSEETANTLAPIAAGVPSSKKTPSGVPAHLVPSPRRLAKLQADGRITDHLSGMQIHADVPENQNLAASQKQEGETHQKELPPSSHTEDEPPSQSNSSAVPQQTQDISPNQKEGDDQQSDPSPKTTTELPDKAQTAKGKVGQASTSSSQEPLQQPEQDEESGEAKVTPTGPTSLNPQKPQDEETESASQPLTSSHHDPPREPSYPDGDTQQPLEEGAPKAEVARAGTPYPELPHPQDSTNTNQTQAREAPATVLPRSRLAPTRLPQPRVLAPLQSPRPTPKLLSPSREDALGTASDQTLTPSPRPLQVQEGDPSKLPPISPPHSGPSSQQAQEETVREVKLPLISPPVQEQAPDPPPGAAQVVRLPRISTPFTERQRPPNRGPRPAKERQGPKVGHSSSKKIPDLQTSSQNQEAGKPTEARKKKLPIQRETANGPTHVKTTGPSHGRASQRESQSKPMPPKASHHPRPSPSALIGKRKAQSTEVPEPPHAAPLPKDPQLQEEKKERGHSSPKKTHNKLPSSALIQKVAMSRKKPSLKRENSEGLSQAQETSPSDGQPAHTSPPQSESPAEASPGGSASVGAPGRKGQGPQKRRAQKREPAAHHAEAEPGGAAPVQAPVREAQADQGTSQARGSAGQGDSASGQQAKEKRPHKHRGAARDQSPATPQQSVEEQGSRKGRLRARGSQSTKV
ncbi:PREDICTED: leucine-rich repeat and guanylate kinase domain-containing protein [Condylura cristata]|uniref:leucine-rich repeat and guanylate kinase domain-containing protein n=1 Tax=Condylura cristata TaxID=143302 RepID=UPI00064286DB|nr:PREDICTED: leucine-rich repeat and guanylate kinase domain-containing protein [Condylura cristata]